MSNKTNDNIFDPAQVAADFETPPLSSAEARERVERLAAGIDLMDSLTAASYGAKEQRELGDQASYLLSRAHEGAQENAMAAIDALLEQIRALQIDQVDRPRPFPLCLFSRGGRKLRKLKKNYGAISLLIDRLTEKLDLAMLGLIKERALLDSMYRGGKEAYHALNWRILAGELALKRHQEGPQGDTKAGHQDKDSFIPAFSQRLTQLRQSKAIGLQQAIQIRLTQFNQSLLIDKLNQTINIALPLWQEQLALALRIDRQQELLSTYRDAAKDTADALNAAKAALEAGETDTSHHTEKALDSLIKLRQADRQLKALMEGSIAIARETSAKESY